MQEKATNIVNFVSSAENIMKRSIQVVLNKRISNKSSENNHFALNDNVFVL